MTIQPATKVYFVGIAFVALFLIVAALPANAHSAVVSVTEWDNIPTLKRSIIVRLSREVSLEELEQIGSQIRMQDAGYKRVFIEYYLPGMKEGAGAWGITHWTPNKDIKIFGNVQRFDHLTEEEANEALSIEYLQDADVAALLADKEFIEREEAAWASVSCDGVKGTDALYLPYRSADRESREIWARASFVWGARQMKAEASGKDFDCGVTRKYLENGWLKKAIE